MALLSARLAVGKVNAERLNWTEPDTLAPTVPGALVATAVDAYTIALTWTASTDNFAVVGYQVYHCAGTGCTPAAHIASVAALTFTHTGLTPRSTHRYQVRAYDAATNFSGWSTVAEATTAQAPPRPPLTFVWLFTGGAWVDVTEYARVAGATITQALNEVMDTATLTFSGAIPYPLKGTPLVISDVAGVWMFAGPITAVRTVYQGRAANIAFECDALDWTWLLGARKVTARYTGWTTADVVYLLIVNFAPAGFTLDTTGLTNNAPIDEITFTNEDLPQAISRVCERGGAYWYVDAAKAIRIFTSAGIPSAGVIDDSTPRGAARLAKHDDGAAVVTRVHARGGGSTASISMPAGASTLPVEDAVWYAHDGGLVECGPQRIAYTGVSDPGTGALVGSGNAPSAAPTVAPASGTNLIEGAAYGYAVSFVTSAGETLPGAVVQYRPVGGSIPPAPPPAVGTDIYDQGVPGARWVNGGSYRWAWEKNIEGGGRVAGTPTPPTIVNGHYWRNRIPSELFGDPAVFGVTPFRTTNGGGTFYADGQTYLRGAAGWATTGEFSDGDLAQFAQMGGGAGALLSARLSQLPVYAKAGVVTARKLYRTAANGATLHLLATLNDNTTTAFTDTVADAGLGAPAPITDTSGIQGGGQINAGVPSILVSNAGAFSPSGGWVQVSGLTLRFTGVSGSSLVLAEPLPNTLSYGSEILNAAHLTGIPASGPNAIVYPIKGGDEVYVFVIREDAAAIAALATATGGDGIRIEFLTDGRLALAELTTRAEALLTMRKHSLVTVTFETRDAAVSVGKTITIHTTAPPIDGTFLIQRVELSQFPARGSLAATPALRVVEASSRRYTFEDLVMQIKLLGRIN